MKRTRKLFQKFDAIIVGAGHNGLVCGSYLAKCGKKVLILERRHLVGGAAVTEEIIPGFKFSRASYLCSLLRSDIIKELELKKNGLEFIKRNPSSFTPMLDGRYLFLGPEEGFNKKEIAKFSVKDAENYEKYEKYLGKFVDAIDGIIDIPPYNPKVSIFKQKEVVLKLFGTLKNLGTSIPEFIEILTSPASKILKRWFESEPLISTLATDAIIGEMTSPSIPGSSYVLLHHVMGDGENKGDWSYVRGGMGGISESIAKTARDLGVEIKLNSPVKSFIIKNKTATGVLLEDGTEYHADIIVSNLSSYNTFVDMMDEDNLPESFLKHIKEIDHSSATFKINLAVDKLPNFKCLPNKSHEPGPQHFGTVHFVENLEQIEQGYLEAKFQKPCSRPIIEMTIPSSLDDTLSPAGMHVVQLFTQYAPYTLENGQTWTEEKKREYAQSAYKVIEQYCPGFTASIIGEDLLSPVDLEKIFGMKGGNIFHGSIRLDQLYWWRPVYGYSSYFTPVKNLYLSGASSHPGGGVIGAPGRNCAREIMKAE